LYFTCHDNYIDVSGTSGTAGTSGTTGTSGTVGTTLMIWYSLMKLPSKVSINHLN